MSLTATQKKTAQAIVNVFETGKVHGEYGQVTLLAGDTGHLTYGRAQTTLASGNLAILVKAYCEADEAALASKLVPYLPRLEGRDLSLDHDEELKSLLRAAGDDPVMHSTQDGFFDRVYWEPALRSAEWVEVAEPLSVSVVYDSRIHGSWHRIRDGVIKDVGRPADFGERKWVSAYVEARKNWLANHSNKLLRKTVYRMDSFEKLISQRKWNLALPITVHGVVINQTALRAEPAPTVVASAAASLDQVLALRTPFQRGAAVRKLQKLLGFATTEVDGVFGPHTDLAVRQFQRENDLVIDGKVGSATWAALESQS